MTLFRHLTWLVLFFSFLIQAGSASLFIWHSQSTINDNNQNQAHNTAEFLINTLAVNAHQQDLNYFIDPNQLQQLTDPLIESGQYKSIAVFQGDQVLYSQELPLIIDAVPTWFSKRFGIQSSPININKMINSSDIQVVVEMNQEKTNYNLFRTVKNAAQWVLIGMIATSIALFYSMKKLLSPLNELEKHAKAISNRQFDHIMPIPQTRELQQVAVAMNTMSNKLHQLFNEQLDIIQHARALAFEDHLTGLPNSISFENVVQLMQNNYEDHKNGFIILCKLDGITKENRKSGRQITDQFIKTFSQTWHDAWKLKTDSSFVARYNSSEFLAWFETKNYEDIHSVIQQIQTRFNDQKNQQKQGAFLNIHMSLYFFDSRNHVDTWAMIYDRLIGNVQYAVEQNSLCIGPDYRSNAITPVEYAASHHQKICTGDVCYSQKEWSEILTNAIAEKNIILKFQPIACLQTDNHQNIPYSECFMRLPHDGQLYTGAEIWPVIDELGLTYAFDRLIIQMALAHLNENPCHKLSLNISNSTLENSDFTNWLEQLLKNYPDLIDCLSIDVKESFLESPKAINTLVELKTMGINLILDRTIAHKSTIDNFVRLPVSALKINIQFLKQAQQVHNDSQDQNDDEVTQAQHQHLFITHLITLCRSCDVAIIIDGIETEQDSDLAWQFKPTAAQGYYLCTPLDSCQECDNWRQVPHHDQKAS
ncbi:MAG: EAL domain-containing protein [Pseudomonadota bacterium]|nr:hypothetical protein [Gammaproteobacteria bacterium]MEC8012441.1 EAL domain-containing protein [Pseudomonadota bacterium]HBF07199.1 hypothetical protein [Gammaproteobacteria bacterium]